MTNSSLCRPLTRSPGGMAVGDGVAVAVGVLVGVMVGIVVGVLVGVSVGALVGIAVSVGGTVANSARVGRGAAVALMAAETCWGAVLQAVRNRSMRTAVMPPIVCVMRDA